MDGDAMLSSVVGEIEACPQEWQAFLNRRTGECWTVGNEEADVVIRECEKSGAWDDDDEEDRQESDNRLPEWQRESLVKAREVLNSEEWIDLPTMQDFDEYRVMEEFCESVADGRIQERLYRAIEGRGAFRRFKAAVNRAGIEDRWFALRNERLTAFVAEWLDSQGIAYIK